MPNPRFDTVLINGSVGTGKTTTAEALGEALQGLGIPGAVIDMDWLRRSWPAPAGDRFRTALALENLLAVAANFRRAGARVLVVATVVETTEQLDLHAQALVSPESATQGVVAQGAAQDKLLHVRLAASSEAVLARLTTRHQDDEDGLCWHAERHPELAGILDRAGFTDELRIDTTDISPGQVAAQILGVLVA